MLLEEFFQAHLLFEGGPDEIECAGLRGKDGSAVEPPHNEGTETVGVAHGNHAAGFGFDHHVLGLILDDFGRAAKCELIVGLIIRRTISR